MKETNTVTVTVAEALNGLEGLLDNHGLESFSDLKDDLTMEIEATVDVDEVCRLADYVPEGENADDIVAGMEPSLRDIEDGVASLLAGDRHMASLLLCRAFHEWADAERVVETALRNPRPDRRVRSMPLFQAVA